MFINTTISEIDKKSGLSLRTGKSLSCVLNLGYVSEITQHGSGSRFYWVGGLDKRDGDVRMTCSTSVADMITAINNGYNPAVYTATAYRNNNPTRGTYSVAIPSSKILMLYSDPVATRTWLKYEDGGTENTLLVNASLSTIFTELTGVNGDPISAVVEDAAPTNVVLTFPTARPTLTDTDFTIAGKTITGAVWAGVVLTLTLSTPIVYAETPVVTFVRTGQTANITNNTLPLLDNYAATIAYSTRLLRTAYAGNCLKVRRSSDDATQDIGFVDGLLDETSLLAFVGAGDGYINTFYDQSGNNQDLIQPTTTKQPLIVSGGTVLKVNNRPYLSFNGTSDGLYKMTCSLFKNIGAISLFTVNQYKANPTANSSGILISVSFDSGSRAILGAGVTSNKYFAGGRRLDGDTFRGVASVGDVGTSQKQITSINDYANSAQYLYINGSLDRKDDAFQSDGVTSNTDSYVINIGGNVNALGTDGTWSNINIWEVIGYASDQSANRLSIEANQRSFFLT